MTARNVPSNLVSKLAYLEREIHKIKQATKIQTQDKQLRKSKPLRGLLKGIKIEPSEIEDSKKSLFKTN